LDRSCHVDKPWQWCLRCGNLCLVHQPTSSSVLRELLRRWKDERNGNWLRLSEALQEVARQAGYCVEGERPLFDRRNLQAFVMDGSDMALTFVKMDVLDAFLRAEFRQPFASLFEPAQLLPALLADDHIKIFLGAQPRVVPPDTKRTDLSHWDSRAMQEFFALINKVSGRVKLDFEDVLFEWPSRADALPYARELDVAGSRTSIVSIGSQRASPVTELMLARMFDVEPFRARPVRSHPLPFQFLWDDGDYPSAFSGHIAVPRKRADDCASGRAPWALRIGTRIHRLERFVPRSKTFGVLAAQRRSTGNGTSQLWLVIAGLSGPGTTAAARFVGDAALSVPRVADGKNSPVMWMAVEADVTLTSAAGDNREITRCQRLAGPEVYDAGSRVARVGRIC
jgi:hypothetical protein